MPEIKCAVGIGHQISRSSIRTVIRHVLMKCGVKVIGIFTCDDDNRRSLTTRWFAAIGYLWNFRLGGASKGDTFENDLLKLIFNATAIANIADNASASPLTNLHVALHTSSPGDSGNQTTNEIAYTSYARVAVARTTGGWTVTSNSVSPVATIGFPAGTGASGTATHFSIGTASSGTGKILYHGTVTPNIVCGNGVTPELTTATAITED